MHAPAPARPTFRPGLVALVAVFVLGSVVPPASSQYSLPGSEQGRSDPVATLTTAADYGSPDGTGNPKTGDDGPETGNDKKTVNVRRVGVGVR